MRLSSFRKQTWYRVALWIGLAACLILLWQVGDQFLTAKWRIPIDDYWRYWTTWRINRMGYDPYAATNLRFFLKELPILEKHPDYLPMILVPPWTLAMLSPFLLPAYASGRISWWLSSIAILAICANVIWRLYGGSKRQLGLAWLVAFTLMPTIWVLMQAQITVLVLLGITGFLYWTNQRQNDWLAGLSLALTTIKPQLVLLLWMAVLFWVIQQRRWKILLGCGLAILAASLVVVLDNPAVFQQFIHTYLANTPVEWKTPTLGYYLRLLMGLDLFWLQLAPLAIGMIWMAIHWFRNRMTWQWLEQAQTILWAAFLTSAYSWTYDMVLLLVPILAAFAAIVNRRGMASAILSLGSFLLINALAVVLHGYFNEQFFIWLAPALLLWYWFATRTSRKGAGLAEQVTGGV